MEIRKVKKKPMKIRQAKEQSIKVKTDSIKLAGVQGAKSATRQIEGGQEVLDAAMTAYVISQPERAVAKHGTKLVKKKVKENKEKQKKAEKKAAEEKLTEQRMEEYTFKGKDIKSVTDSFIAKMSSLSTTMSSISGFDMKA